VLSLGTGVAGDIWPLTPRTSKNSVEILEAISGHCVVNKEAATRERGGLYTLRATYTHVNATNASIQRMTDEVL
jgi:hypothetical protein